MSPVPVRSAFSHTLVAGMAVGATLAAAGITAPPAAAVTTGLAVTPSTTTAGASPEYTLSWNRVSAGSTMQVTLAGFTTDADASCSSSAGTVRLAIGSTAMTYECSFDAAARRFTLTRPTDAFWPVDDVALVFPAGMILSPDPDTGTFTVEDFDFQATASVDIAPPANSPAPPDWMRQYQRGSADEQCLPQWNPSYAMWANAGAGGWICVQTDHWDTSLGRWTLL